MYMSMIINIKLTIIIMIILSSLFMMLNHPMSMAMTIMLMTLSIALFTGMMMGMFWFSYIIIMIMVSGMLVLLVYMSNVSSNEKFKMNFNMILFPALMGGLGSMSVSWESGMTWIMNIETIPLIMLFNTKFKLTTLLLVIYLFMAMMIISLMVNIHEGPLRTKL